MVHVVAYIETKPGRREAFLKIFHELVPAVHAEDGCIEYGPTIDAEPGVDAQTNVGSNFVVVMEKWESASALEAHLAAPHMEAFREQVKDLVVGIKIHVLAPVG